MSARANSGDGLTRRGVLAAGSILLVIPTAASASRADLERDASASLQNLYAQSSKAAELGSKARAVLVFPAIVKAGFMVGGQNGSGVLFKNGRPIGYYRLSAGSFGFQAGAQKFSYALFFMTADSLAYLQKSQGWALGSGPSIVVLDKGKAASMTTTTLSQAVYAMPYGQHGLMGGIGLEGSKITPINPD
ncbi:MAG TPA: lipid-binding SYLF domain-containing protein [Caulobacteraceae bacterium]|nr:lipid-binding SYLF domain-containing protein [Caulobacteraceae bacterium]